MQRDELAEALDRRYPAVLFMWIGMLFSLAIYGAVGWLVVGRMEPIAPGMENILGPVLIVVALTQAVISFAISWKIPASPEGPPAFNLDREGSALQDENTAGRSAESFERAWGRIHRRLTISFALADGIGIYGLILHLLTGGVAYLGFFLVGAAVVLIRQFPSRRRLRAALERKTVESDREASSGLQ